MKINNPETLKRALANIKLESMPLSPEVQAIMERALIDRNVDTEEIKELLLSPYMNKCD